MLVCPQRVLPWVCGLFVPRPGRDVGLSKACRDLAVATVLFFGDHETVAIVLVLAAFGVAIWYQVRKGRKKSTVKLALWLALLIVLWWFGTGHGSTPPPH
jgi:hypothetical protein